MSKVFIEESTLTAIGDAIRGKTGKEDLIAPLDMATEIGAIETGGGGIPEEALVISGDCTYRFAQGGWDWFIKEYGDKITTDGILKTPYMFYYSKLENIPFDLNFEEGKTHDINQIFYNSNIKSIPKFNNCNPGSMNDMFRDCKMLRIIPDDIESWFNWTSQDGATSGYSASRASTFYNCYSLRSIPSDFFSHGNKVANYSYTCFYTAFYNCYSLDELINLPIIFTVTYTSNLFNNTFSNCYRLKNLTFAMPDGQPYAMNWKSQVIDFGSYIGYGNANSIVNYNSGITVEKRVTDDASYQALKDDPDWYTSDPAYSRYNHDSAVATINSLPDTSAYLATAGGTNTIKFKKSSGSRTDGGAIENLTEAEIAVATAKGWTVSLMS